MPYIEAADELKSKPTQHSVKELRSIGIQPDIIVCRTVKALPEDMKRKIALFCDVEPDAVINNLTASSIYEVPLMLRDEGLDRIALEKLGLDDSPCDMKDWEAMVSRILSADKTVNIALVGKYVELHDAYLPSSKPSPMQASRQEIRSTSAGSTPKPSKKNSPISVKYSKTSTASSYQEASATAA